jgi:hypothetical protein
MQVSLEMGRHQRQVEGEEFATNVSAARKYYALALQQMLVSPVFALER